MQIAQYNPELSCSAIDPEGLISADLLRDSYRSETFPQDWTDEQRRASLRRYVQWLTLKRENPRSRLAPTRDIDLFWHLHMLRPVAYFNDCIRLIGRIVDHDGGFGKGEGELPRLQEVFGQTAQMWESRFDSPYREDGKWLRDAVATDCWHDCQDRCWHACSDGK
jgi:hypothetical protein